MNKSIEYLINIPNEVRSNYSGYSQLMKCLDPLLSTDPKSYIIDFANNRWFDSNLFPIIDTYVLIAQEHKSEILCRPWSKSPKLMDIMIRNNFLHTCFNGDYKPKRNETVVPFKHFSTKASGAVNFGEYIDKELKKYFPKMNQRSKNLLRDYISELFINADYHGKCQIVTTCGQYYPTIHKLDFTIVNAGNTIKKNVVEFHNKKRLSSPDHCISWAVELGHSTKDNISGGLGLFFLEELYKHNDGRFQIISDNEYWELKGKYYTKEYLKYNFPGTIINMELDQNDDFTYCFDDISAENEEDYSDDLFGLF